MKIAICDDNSLDRELICDLLRVYFSEKPFTLEIAHFENGINLLHDIGDGSFYDIIFLDIYMDSLLGIDVAKQLRDRDYRGEIVFVTASSDYVVDGYEVQASAYLLKPHSYEKLSAAMDHILRGRRSECMYYVKHRKDVICIPYNEILYVESSNSKCILHRTNGTCYTLYKQLGDVERELKDIRFLRCHQSFLVNMNCIQQIHDRQFELSTGDTVLIRQRDFKNIRQQYLDYIEGKG